LPSAARAWACDSACAPPDAPGSRTSSEYADEAQPEDVTFQSHGVTVVIDPKSLPYIDGTELDYTKEGLNEGFKFNNPNVKDACGCGESFNV
jgi:iron-sulfur cluster assembly protein